MIYKFNSPYPPNGVSELMGLLINELENRTRGIMTVGGDSRGGKTGGLGDKEVLLKSTLKV